VRILSIDTCMGACGCAVLDGERLLARRFEPMLRGHQERLALQVEGAMAEAGLAFADLDRIGVTVGPGSFTGLRVGLAFAKGLGVALDIPVVGVGSLQALAAGEPDDGLVLALIDARRGQAYWQAFRAGAALAPPAASSLAEIVAFLETVGQPDVLIGPGAFLLGETFPTARLIDLPGPDPKVVADLAANSPADDGAHPLYLRTPDAKLPGGLDPPRPLLASETPRLAVIHGEAFDPRWSAEEIAALLAQTSVFGLAIGEPADGFILCQGAAGEAEILTLTVRPQARRRGLGRALVATAKAQALRSGVAALFLEVAADNAAALALYRAAGFVEAGRRRGYYPRADGAIDALILRCDLNSANAPAYAGADEQ